MTSRLSLYNDALLYCGERSLASLTEEREPRRLLDQVWDGGGVDFCLEQAQWRFAMRTLRVDPDETIEPEFGYANAFTKPSDWILTSAVCEDEYFRVPLNQYVDENGVWYADIDPLYVRIVSNDPDFGMNLGGWPETFTQYVALYFASRISTKLSSSAEKWQEINKLMKLGLTTAKNKASMGDPAMFPAKGAWSRARTRGSRRGDGGNQSGNLIG